MTASDITHVLVDTNALWSLGGSDFQKIVRLSRVKPFQIIVPHIVWEERRTQLLESEYSDVLKLKSAYEKLENRGTESILSRLNLAPMTVWPFEEADRASRTHMAELAIRNNFEIISLDPAHAERAWVRYFGVDAPFNPNEKRENRRKDIPDSWILECAVDLAKSHQGLWAICKDGRLADALKSTGFEVFATPTEMAEALEEKIVDRTESTALPPPHIASEVPNSSDPLSELLARVQKESRTTEHTVLGIVGYFGTISHRELATMLDFAGIKTTLIGNAVERLVLTELIRDTGNALLIRNKEACELAATQVVPLIARYVEATNV